VIGSFEGERGLLTSDAPGFVKMWFFDEDPNGVPPKIPRGTRPLLEVALDDVVLFLPEVLLKLPFFLSYALVALGPELVVLVSGVVFVHVNSPLAVASK
jgi:hypothetical protein